MPATDLASDADLLVYAPEASAVAVGLRTLALEDAAERIDATNLRGQTRYAHAMLAAHLLAMNPASGLEPRPAVLSKKFAALSITYGRDVKDAGPYAGSAYGLAYWEAIRTTPHSPLVG